MNKIIYLSIAKQIFKWIKFYYLIFIIFIINFIIFILSNFLNYYLLFPSQQYIKITYQKQNQNQQIINFPINQQQYEFEISKETLNVKLIDRIKRKQAEMKKNYGKNFWAAISIAVSCYYLFGLYRDWLIALPFWQKWRQEKMTSKESYEYVIQGFHPMRKTLIQQFSQF